MKKALLHLNHILIQSLTNQDDIVVDMTCGHGYDTELLAKLSKHVYAFDIQLEALNSAKSRLNGLNNVTFIHDSFEHVNHYVKHASLYIFNLGYLPKGNKSVTTTKDVTLSTLTLLHEKIMLGSHVIVMSYIGHEEGKKEYDAIYAYLINQNEYQVYETKALHHALAPILIWIQKKDSI